MRHLVAGGRNDSLGDQPAVVRRQRAHAWRDLAVRRRPMRLASAGGRKRSLSRSVPKVLLVLPSAVSPYFSRGDRKMQAQLVAGLGVKTASAVTGRRAFRGWDESRVVAAA